MIVRECPGITRLVVARHDGRTLILHPTHYEQGDLLPMLTPAEVALLRTVA